MNTQKPIVLIVDDEKNILKTMEICFHEMGFITDLYDDPKKAVEGIHNKTYDLAFVDLKMAPINGMEVLKEIQYCSPSTTTIIMTAHGSIENAVEAIKAGAYHYLQKPFDYIELELLANKVLEYHKLKNEIHHLKTGFSALNFPGSIVTRNEKMREMVSLAEQVAGSDLSILIEGESGTGKELYANLVQDNSLRKDKPFVKINCAALSENLLESELFGHVQGAYTGAIKDRSGRFEYANGGTIFLDEIAEISPAVQAKLLRVFQQGEYERLGESVTRKTDVRVIAATNRNLDEALKEGTFREDLFYRLSAVRIKLLPLRERPEDIPLLINYFIKNLSTDENPVLATEALKAMRAYTWRGNVRELENVVKRLIVLSKNNLIELDSLPEEIKNQGYEKQPLSLEEIEKSHIKKVLQYAKDLADASEILGIDPATLYRKRKRYNL